MVTATVCKIFELDRGRSAKPDRRVVAFDDGVAIGAVNG